MGLLLRFSIKKMTIVFVLVLFTMKIYRKSQSHGFYVFSSKAHLLELLELYNIAFTRS